MTPEEFRAARKALGMTQKQLSEALRMGAHGWQTISKWENDGSSIPGPVELAIECLLHHPKAARNESGTGKPFGKPTRKGAENGPIR